MGDPPQPNVEDILHRLLQIALQSSSGIASSASPSEALAPLSTTRSVEEALLRLLVGSTSEAGPDQQARQPAHRAQPLLLPPPNSLSGDQSMTGTSAHANAFPQDPVPNILARLQALSNPSRQSGYYPEYASLSHASQDLLQLLALNQQQALQQQQQQQQQQYLQTSLQSTAAALQYVALNSQAQAKQSLSENSPRIPLPALPTSPISSSGWANGVARSPSLTMASFATLPAQASTGRKPSPTSFPRPQSHRDADGPEPFPQKLFRLLNEAERLGFDNIISFMPSGKSFCIHQPHQFIKEVAPNYFRHSKLSSFTRQLQLYQFSRTVEGASVDCYVHIDFQKGHPELLYKIRRASVSKK
ncbi:predicted protein [Phaeodactylum tricornutum CCAP 1055/1]|jgi:hypothetical protein|uniref:HSF-type DNA-binding domain-containing protein n=1 Tax=Phaeodactylum tricornutum (strain CCAP 1055/1) TaxID=556484 RepID=B7FXI6_PHATC|nr:predicted protein [Phaeodactylum tricornutum CCAP 1055/1]EEC48758.1 predicted protein [Phaeodactylum tricornutum CCAP 1055/1]|eukprot:XP_002179772.1 predicted protein [Phaeodactylum tricornutum CCAP 1055/1]